VLFDVELTEKLGRNEEYCFLIFFQSGGFLCIFYYVIVNQEFCMDYTGLGHFTGISPNTLAAEPGGNTGYYHHSGSHL
jgi:hypothetical protein